MAETESLPLQKIMAVVNRLYDSRVTLKAACETEKVAVSTFFRNLDKHPIAREEYVRAQDARAEMLADEIIDISDTESDPQRARNRIDARKWSASKLKPGKFGDRLDVNVNQTVDIGKALQDARSRVPLPVSYPESPKPTEPIDITAETKVLQSDIRSDKVSSNSPAPLTEEEILS